jgi:hypothetical protein
MPFVIEQGHDDADREQGPGGAAGQR